MSWFFCIVCVLFCVWECFYVCHMSFFLPGNVMLRIYLKKRETNAWLCKHWGINSARAQNISKLTQRLFFTQCAQIQICTRIMTHVRQRSGRKRICWIDLRLTVLSCHQGNCRWEFKYKVSLPMLALHGRYILHISFLFCKPLAG